MSNPSYCLSHQQISYIQSNASKLYDFPPPGTQWDKDDVPEYLIEDFHRIRELRIILRDGDEWEMDEDAWEAVQVFRPDEEDLLPCGHSGFTNTGRDDDKRYKCNTCGEFHMREDIEKALAP